VGGPHLTVNGIPQEVTLNLTERTDQGKSSKKRQCGRLGEEESWVAQPDLCAAKWTGGDPGQSRKPPAETAVDLERSELALPSCHMVPRTTVLLGIMSYSLCVPQASVSTVTSG
jgi:hypothetical protein